MAVSANFSEEIEKLLECNICLERLYNPKVLRCTHSFCKTCLDGILIFRADGSADINCPLRCEEVTEIPVHQTTNNLAAPLQLKNIIELLIYKIDGSENKEGDLRCQDFGSYRPDCRKTVSVSCSVCLEKICSSCQTNHKHDEQQSIEFIPIKYKEDDNEWLPWCSEHATYATYACQDGFICLYCKARKHSNHRFDTIKTLSQQVTTWVSNMKPHLPDLEGMLNSCTLKTTAEMKRIKDALIREVKRRKLISIQRHLKKLNEEEAKILSVFESEILNHFASYPLNKPVDYIENKEKFEIFTKRDCIFEAVRNITSSEVKIPQISFTLFETAVNETHPLGELKGITGTAKLTKDMVTASSLIAEEELTNEFSQILIYDLKQIQKELDPRSEDEDTEQKNAGPDYQKLLDTLRTYEQKPNDRLKMSYLSNLISNHNFIAFKLLWQAIPERLLQLRCRGCNMLHVAASFDKPEFFNVILDAGMDVNENENGFSALFIAAGNRNLSIVKLLVERNANILMTVDGYNVVDFAKKANYPEILEFLLDHLMMNSLEDNGTFKDKSIENMVAEGLVEPFDQFDVEQL